MATTKAFELAQLSALTTVDASGNVTTNTSQIANASGDLTLDSAADIILNVDGGDLRLYDGTAQFGRIANDSTDLVIEAYVADRSMVFKGLDGTTPISALTIDMSNGGRATFNENIVVAGTITGVTDFTSSGDMSVGGDLTVTGDLTVEGSQVTLNTTALDVEDKNITLNYHASNDTSASADGAGITIQDAVDASNDASILWDATNDKFTMSHGLTLLSANHLQFTRGGELRSTDTGGTIRTLVRVNGSNELEYGWSANGAVKFMGGGSYTERMRIHTNSNIGINDIAPHGTLTVTGPRILVQRTNDDSSIAFANNATGAPSSHTWAAGLNYSNSHAFTIAYGASGVPSLESHKMVIDTSGKVGIGTDGPVSPLHIQADGIALRFDGTANTSRSIFFRNTTASNPAEIYADGSLRFRTEDANTNIIFNNNSTGSNNETMRLTSDGKVGIGTDSPETKLDVRVDSNSAYDPIMSGVPSYTPSASDIIQIRNTESGVDDIYAGIWFETGNPATNTQGTDRSGRIALLVDNNDGYSSNFVFQTRSSDGQLKEKMRITQEGYVGIGTTDPAVSLHIGDGTTDEFVIIDKGSSNTSGILFRNAGNNKVKLQVNPSEELEIHTNNTIKAKVTEAGTVYNYNNQADIRPTVNWDFANSKKLDGVITFYRNSRASYYDESGTIRYAGENEPRFNHDPLTRESKGFLIERSSSNLISNSVPNEVMNWQGTNAYMISNQALAPDGTYSAVMIHDLATSGTQFHGVYKLFSVSNGTTYTYSAYLKKGDEDSAGMRIYDGAGMVCRATFNLANGTHTLHNGSSSSMTHVGNGWYHCIITGTASNTTSSADAYVFTTSVYTHTSTGDNSVYAWGVQVESKNFATSLIPDELTHTNRTSDGTYYDENGKLVTAPNGSPRYGYKWDGRKWEETGLIIESTSTNYVTYDLTHDNPKWYIAGSGASGVSNPTDYFSTTQTAPDGSYTAVFLDASSAATPSLSAAYNVGASSGWGSATYSLFVKPYGTTDVYSLWIDNGSGTNGATAQFQISTMSSQGTRVNGGISIGNTWMEKVGDGWYRLAMTCHDTIPQAQLRVYAADGVYGANEDGYGSATGSSTTASRGSYFWGAQLEAVSSPTSYIHRIDGGATTTRSADIISVATPERDDDIAEARDVRHLIPSVEGTIYTEWDTNQPQGNFGGIFEILESGTNGIDHRITGSAVQYYISNNNAVANGGLPTPGETNKTALAYDLTSVTDSETARNGVHTGINTVHIWDLDLQHIRLGSIDFNTAYQLDGHIKAFKLYEKRLSGVEIQAMTEND